VFFEKNNENQKKKRILLRIFELLGGRPRGDKYGSKKVGFVSNPSFPENGGVVLFQRSSKRLLKKGSRSRLPPGIGSMLPQTPGDSVSLSFFSASCYVNDE